MTGTFVRSSITFLDEKNQAGTEGLEYAASKGLGVIIMEPLRGGSLAKTVPPAVEAIWNEATVKRTPAEWAFRWVWNRPEVTVVLSGMNEEAHIKENMKIADEAYPDSLTEAELQLISKIEQKYRQIMKVGCTGCQYCMPCPSGVNIPECFNIYNHLSTFGNADEANFMYVALLSGTISGGKPELASQCVQCGQCLENVPSILIYQRFSNQL